MELAAITLLALLVVAAAIWIVGSHYSKHGSCTTKPGAKSGGGPGEEK